MRNEQLTGLKQLHVLIDGTVRRVDQVETEVQTPFFSKKVKAVCMQKPIYDLIIGNLLGVRGLEAMEGNNDGKKYQSEEERHGDVSNKKSEENRKNMVQLRVKELQRFDQIQEVAAVKTRAQVVAEHYRKERPLKTPEINVKDMTLEQVKKDQRENAL